MDSMTSAPIIRVATEADNKSAARLNQVALEFHHRALNMLFRPMPSSAIDTPEERVDRIRFVVEIEGIVVGMIEGGAKIITDHPILADRKFFEITSVILDETYRGRGIGRMLMAEIEKFAQERGYPEIELNVYAFNEHAITLYQELGYEILNIRMRKTNL